MIDVEHALRVHNVWEVINLLFIQAIGGHIKILQELFIVYLNLLIVRKLMRQKMLSMLLILQI